MPASGDRDAIARHGEPCWHGGRAAAKRRKRIADGATAATDRRPTPSARPPPTLRRWRRGLCTSCGEPHPPPSREAATERSRRREPPGRAAPLTQGPEGGGRMDEVDWVDTMDTESEDRRPQCPHRPHRQEPCGPPSPPGRPSLFLPGHCPGTAEMTCGAITYARPGCYNFMRCQAPHTPGTA